MCGILGQINLNKKETVDEHELKRMRDFMLHRGPDSSGSFVDTNVGLAFRRLSIIDLTDAGAQPMCNEDKSIWIVFNGEFYNYQDYQDELIKKGHVFKSQTDTEVIIHLYEECGIGCLKKINGMFALAIYDKNKDKLFLARDRFGVKPLFYYLDNKRLIFSSELKSISTSKYYNKKIDNNSLVNYFSLGYILPPNTIFKDIKKLEPAKYITFDIAKNKIEKNEIYWDLQTKVNNNLSFDEWSEKFESELKKSIRRRLISDVPVGVFLSGGIDSSSIVAYMHEMGIPNIKTFSIGFKEKDFSEAEYSREVAHKFQTEHHEYIVKPDIMDTLPELTAYFDEPFEDSSALITYYLSKYTKKYVTVVLGGDGADELLAGYQRYGTYDRFNNYTSLVPNYLRKSILNFAGRFLKEGKNRRRMNLLAKPIYQSYQEFMSCFNNEKRGRLLSDNILSSCDRDIDFRDYMDRDNLDFVTSLQYLDTHTYLLGDILTKIDQCSMASSLEARSPFMDYKLWELVFTMPQDMRYNKGVGKYILKKNVSKFFSDDFLHRRKMGFSLPLSHWLRDELKVYVKDILFSASFVDRGYFNMDYIEEILSIHNSGRLDCSRQIWSLLFFEHWCRNWLD